MLEDAITYYFYKTKNLILVLQVSRNLPPFPIHYLILVENWPKTSIYNDLLISGLNKDTHIYSDHIKNCLMNVTASLDSFIRKSFFLNSCFNHFFSWFFYNDIFCFSIKEVGFIHIKRYFQCCSWFVIISGIDYRNHFCSADV